MTIIFLCVEVSDLCRFGHYLCYDNPCTIPLTYKGATLSYVYSHDHNVPSLSCSPQVPGLGRCCEA